MDFLDFHNHTINKNGIYNLNLKEEIPSHKFSTAIHPKDITENWKYDFEIIKTRSLFKNCIAIGECGLDGNIQIDETLQHEILKSHITLAEEIGKPLIIHCVRRFSQILHYKNANVPMIIHGFNKKESIAMEMIEAGFLLSFGKAALENISLQNIIKNIPINKFFLETDDSNFEIIQLYDKVSSIKSVSLENIRIQMWENLDTIING